LFVLSAGMPKSGSTLLSWYQKEIVEHVFPVNGQKQVEESIKEGHIAGIGHFVHNIEEEERLRKLYSLSTVHGPFVVKTHTPLTPDVQEFLEKHPVSVTYIHRDPRDIILSAIDHGRRIKGEGVSTAYFSQFQTIDNSIPLVKDYCRTAIDWISSGLCEIYTYHDLITKPEDQIERFCRMISKSVDDQFVQELIDKYTVNQDPGVRQFNRGKASRFHEEMTTKEIEACNSELSEEIVSLGYLC